MDLQDLFKELIGAAPQVKVERDNPALLAALRQLAETGGKQTDLLHKYLAQSQFAGIDPSAVINKVVGTMAEKFTSGIEDAMRNFASMSADPDSPGSATISPQMSKFMSEFKNTGMQILGAGAARKAQEKVAEFGSMYDRTRKFSGLDSIANMTRAGGGTELGAMSFGEGATVDMDTAFRAEMRLAARSANVAQLALGIGEQKSRDDVASIMMASFSTLDRKLEDVKLDISQSARSRRGEGGLQQVAGPAAIIAAAGAAGVSDQSRNAIISKITREMGGSMQDVADTFVRFTKDMQATGVTADEFSSVISDVAGDLSGYSNQFDSVSSQFGRFMRAVNETDPGKVTAAANAFRNIMNQVTNFATSSSTMANRAFIGGQMGMGGSALSNALEIEEAMASGDKTQLEELNRRIVEEVELRTGSQLLTRSDAQAVAGGAETREAQRQMLAAMYGGNEISSRDFEFFAKGQRGLQDVVGPTEFGAEDTARVFDMALARTEIVEGPAKVAENMFGAVSTAMTNGLAEMQADMEVGITEFFRGTRMQIAEAVVQSSTMGEGLTGSQIAERTAGFMRQLAGDGAAVGPASAVFEADKASAGILGSAARAAGGAQGVLRPATGADAATLGAIAAATVSGASATGILPAAAEAESATVGMASAAASVESLGTAISAMSEKINNITLQPVRPAQISINIDRATLQELMRSGYATTTN